MGLVLALAVGLCACGGSAGGEGNGGLSGGRRNAGLLLTGENTYRLSLGKDGVLSEAGKERLSDTAGKALENCRKLMWKEDGSCLLLRRNTEDSLKFIEYNLRTDILGESVRLPETIPFEDINVLNIINEELGSYFSGQKKAEDAAVIQSRVQMYVQENQ